MKRFLAILASASALFAACEPDTTTTPDITQDESNFIVATKMVEVAAEGGEGVIEYTLQQPSEGLGIEVTNDAEWITNFVVAENITFTVAANEKTEERTSTINLRYGAEEYAVEVKQMAAELPADVVELKLQSTELSFSSSGGNGEIGYTLRGVEEGVKPEVACDVDWVTDIVVGDQSITFVVLANSAEEGRTAMLNVTYDAQSVSATISQSRYVETPEGYPEDSNPDSYNFKHRMLLIDHTGTDCGFCPYMMAALKEVEADPAYNDYFNVVMAHSYNQSDKAYSRAALIIRGYFQVTRKILTGFPTLTFNYQAGKSSQNVEEIKSNIDQLKRETQDAAVAVAAELDGDKIVVKAALKSKESRNYKVNILLLEDDIYCKQSGAYEEWMNTHDSAIRDSYYDLPTDYSDIAGVEWGDVEAMTTEYKSFEMPISSDKWVKENCKVIVIIAAQDTAYGNNYEVVNTAMCGLGESKPFEYR